jgi:hypothetical protein
MNDRVNIKTIIALVIQQKPERQDIVEALQNVPRGHWVSSGYYRFVDSKDAKQPGGEWQFDENIVLEQENRGDIVLDILKDGRIRGIEFIDQVDK